MAISFQKERLSLISPAAHADMNLYMPNPNKTATFTTMLMYNNTAFHFAVSINTDLELTALGKESHRARR